MHPKPPQPIPARRNLFRRRLGLALLLILGCCLAFSLAFSYLNWLGYEGFSLVILISLFFYVGVPSLLLGSLVVLLYPPGFGFTYGHYLLVIAMMVGVFIYTLFQPDSYGFLEATRQPLNLVGGVLSPTQRDVYQALSTSGLYTTLIMWLVFAGLGYRARMATLDPLDPDLELPH